MFSRGIQVRAREDHFDDHYGDIYIEAGDRFEVVDCLGSRSVRLRPADPRKYPGEAEIVSTPDLFRRADDGDQA